MLNIARYHVSLLCFAVAGAMLPAKGQSIVLNSAEPAIVSAGGISQQVVLSGSGFMAGMFVRVGTQMRGATVTSPTSLRFSLNVEDLSMAGEVPLRVEANNGRRSNPITLRIINPVPSITNSELIFTVGFPAGTVDISISGFTKETVLLWNGQPREATSFASGPFPSGLRVQLTATDVGKAGVATLSVRNPEPAGGESDPVFFILKQPVSSLRDVAWDDVGKRFLVSSEQGLRTLDPQTGVLSDLIDIGKRPGRMVITDDGSKLYIALNGEEALGKFSLPALQLEAKYPIGPFPFGNVIEDIAVAPSRNDLVAVSVRSLGVMIVDSNGRRPTMTPRHPPNNVIRFGSDPSVLFGFDNENSGAYFNQLRVGPSGVTLERTLSLGTSGVITQGFSGDFTVFDGKAFMGNGQVINLDPFSARAQVSERGPVVVNPRSGLAYAFPGPGSNMRAFGVYQGTTLERMGRSASLIKAISKPERFITWGDAGVAFIDRTDLYLFPHLTLSDSPLILPPGQTPLVNGANFQGDRFAPGMIATLFGTDLGPTDLMVATAEGNRFPTNLGGLTVTFNSIPAPMIYARTDQAAFVLPYGLVPGTTAQMLVQRNGQLSRFLEVPVSATAPAVFTIPSGGFGQGAILNQDYSVNSASNPADRGSVIQVFMTGGGQTNPPSQDGSVILGVPPRQLASVTASIGGVPAIVEYAGAAPQSIAGLMQVNLRVPAAPPSEFASLELFVGGVPIPLGVRLAIR